MIRVLLARFQKPMPPSVLVDPEPSSGGLIRRPNPNPDNWHVVPVGGGVDTLKAHQYLWSISARYRAKEQTVKKIHNDAAVIFYIEDDLIAVDFALRFG